MIGHKNVGQFFEPIRKLFSDGFLQIFEQILAAKLRTTLSKMA